MASETTELFDLEVSGSQMGGLLGMTPRWVQKLANLGVLARVKRGAFALGPSLRGYIGYVQDQAGQGKTIRNLEEGEEATRATQGDLRRERVRLIKAQADAKEMEVAVMTGELLDRECVQEELGALVAAFRQKMLALPTKCAGPLQGMTDPREIEALLKEVVHGALLELSRYDPERVSGRSAEKRRLVGGSAT